MATVPATVPDMRDMIKHALPNLMTSARISKAGVKDVARSDLHSPRTVRKIVYELASNACASLPSTSGSTSAKNWSVSNSLPTSSSATSATTSAKNWSMSNSLPTSSSVPTKDAFSRRCSHGDAVNVLMGMLGKPELQKRSETPSTFSLSRAAQGVFHTKAMAHITPNGRRVRVGSGLQNQDPSRQNSSFPESESVTQSSSEGDSDSENSIGVVYADILEPDAEPDSMVAAEEQDLTRPSEKAETHEQDDTQEVHRFHRIGTECEAPIKESNAPNKQFALSKEYEVEKQNLTAQFMGAREQVEQLKQRSDQKSAHLIAEQRFRKEAEEEIVRLRSKCMMQAEGTEEMRRNMNLIKDQMETKCRIERDRAGKENLKLKCERAQLAKDKAKLQRELSQMAQLRSKAGNDISKPGNENLAFKIADMECLPLRNCAPEDKASLKKKLLLKWHPDKQPSPEQAVFATQVVQEMQNRPVWKD